MYINSKDPKSWKNSILYSQVLRVKHTCSIIENFKLHYSELKQKFIEKGYNSDLLDKHILTVEKLDRNEMFKEKRNMQAETNMHYTNNNLQSLLFKHH